MTALTIGTTPSTGCQRERECRKCHTLKQPTDFEGHGNRSCIECNQRRLADPRVCFECFEEKPAVEFPWGKSRRRRKAVCRRCIRRRRDLKRREREARLAALKTKTWVTDDGVTMRRCTACAYEGPVGVDFYRVRRDVDPPVWDYRCRFCRKRVATEAKRLARKNPEWRAHQSAMGRAWRRADPERSRASHKRWYQKMKADPVRYARYLESRRLANALKRDQTPQGLEGRRQVTVVMPPDIPDDRLRARPLYELVLREIDSAGETRGVLDRLDITDDALRSWGRWPGSTITFNEADGLLVGLGACWWDVWPEGEEFLKAQELFEGVVADAA